MEKDAVPAAGGLERRPDRRLPSGQPHPRVEEGVKHVHDDVGADDEHCCYEDDSAITGRSCVVTDCTASSTTASKGNSRPGQPAGISEDDLAPWPPRSRRGSRLTVRVHGRRTSREFCVILDLGGVDGLV